MNEQINLTPENKNKCKKCELEVIISSPLHVHNEVLHGFLIHFHQQDLERNCNRAWGIWTSFQIKKL